MSFTRLLSVLTLEEISTTERQYTAHLTPATTHSVVMQGASFVWDSEPPGAVGGKKEEKKEKEEKKKEEGKSGGAEKPKDGNARWLFLSLIAFELTRPLTHPPQQISCFRI